jgi:hypothetical protein
VKIIIESCEFKNFLSFGNKWTSIDFQTGITFVTGKNVQTEKSNGSGKCVDESTCINITGDDDILKLFEMFIKNK